MMKLPTNSMSRGKLAKYSGVNSETIRYYEKIALMPVPDRSEGGHRVYTDSDYQRLCFIRRCRELGFSLRDIEGMLYLVDGNEVSCSVVKEMADARLKDITSKVSDLKRMEITLREISVNCTGTDVPQCPIIEALQSDRRD